MNESSIDLFNFNQIPHVLTFIGTFCERLKLIYKFILKPIISVNHSDLIERKERINKLFIGLRLWPTSLLTNTTHSEKRHTFMKNGNESRDVLGDSRKRYRGPWAEIGKYWPCPLRKKK